jgi:uncharacterized protein (DUF2141 family)
MISLIKKLTILCLIFLVNACANIQSPSGGPSDKKAPLLLKSIPEQNKTNFNGKEITLVFDEEVNADKISSALVITPFREDLFKVRTKKKTVTIIYDKEFEPNTTYTLNFRDAITDLTEKNPANDLTLAFSTGSYIDSISFSGTVTDLQTNTPLENITIGLYKPGDTISLKTGKPVYFDKTDKSGTFTFKNLKNNIYNVYAFQDINRNLHYEENEKIGFIDTFNLKVNKSNIKIPITKLDTKAPEISYIKPGNEKTDVKFNEGIILKQINYTDSLNPILYIIADDAKTLSIFNNQNSNDSIPIMLTISDSTGNMNQLKKNIIFDKKKTTKDLFTLQTEPLDFKVDPGYLKVVYTFNKPVKLFKNNINVLADRSKIELVDSNFTWNKSRTKLSIQKKIKTADTILIESDTNTFIAITGDSLDKQKLTFLTKKEEDYGIIRGTIETKEPSYILELADEKYKTAASIKNSKKFNFKYIKPGTYSIRIIIDENKNGKWDNGNLELKKEPEKIIYYKEKIQLRANWEIENITVKF